MLVVIVYDISTAEAGGQKRLRKVARQCRTLFMNANWMRASIGA